jgi:outer membrane receptor protein involved in Fe transport
MFYARVATGFVPGGPNVAPFNVPPGTVPETYNESTTTNYEIGYKGTLIDGRLTAEVAAFLIEWDDIQMSQAFGTYSMIVNGETAVSQGVEWAFNYVPMPGLTLGFTGAYTDAHLTADAPNASDGDRLPVTPEWQAALSGDYEWPVSANYSAFVGADWRYIGDREAEFAAVRQELPSYSLVDLRTGIRTDHWTLGLYAKNIADEDAIFYVINRGRQSSYIATPRTIGVEFTVDF